MKKVSQKMSLEKALDQFIKDNKRPFRLEKVIQHVVPLLKKIPTSLYISIDQIIRRDRRFFFDDFKEFYIPRAYFFKNTQFLIKLTKEEIKEGILFPGHRFVPFCHWEIFPSLCKIRWEKSKLKTKKIQKKFQDILMYHSLLGKENIISYLMVDSEENADLLSKHNSFSENISINVFDIKEFVKAYDFQEGDFLQLTVKDWYLGKYTIEYYSAPNNLSYHSNKNNWIEAFENNMLDVFEEEGALTSIYEQLSIAFFKSGKEFTKNPFLHVGGFLEMSKKIEMSPMGMTEIFWRKNEVPEDSIDFDNVEYQIGMTGNTESLDGILQDLGVAINEQIIEAFMRDELYSARNDFSNVLERCFQGQTFSFYDKEQEKCFEELLIVLWDETRKNYNLFCDKKAGVFRAKSLTILESYYKWLNHLDKENIEEKYCPKRETLSLGEIQVMLMHLVAGFNEGDSYELAKQVDMLDSLLDIEYSTQSLMDIIEKEAIATMPPSVKIFQNFSTKKSKKIYNLKISLKKSKPLIWRRVCVPEEILLKDLHSVIQVLMGWKNNQEHRFLIKSETYGNLSDFKDESSYSLKDFITKTKESFEYEYDFEDSWKHKILVQKITECNPPKKIEIKCLAGKNACPPENCGGIYGYEELLEILKDSSDPEYPHLVEWLEGFDPKFFDIKKINDGLEKL